ncbi:substrate-binding domain-containing protein [Minwuia thermotolerans]|uniref:Sulfate transporter n=1 Tax=Minwuia thermotolerans TaxID=2056226 RepID=A0A2M9G2A6_9PROT|nr:substrate-binding domain-containing protein [Minwuia thermotolerans]PJK29857.1 sulfate transporter [Minwuia thermotolerans]
MPIWRTIIGLTTALTVITGVASADDRFITLASTTSTENSGLFGHILPKFTSESGIEVRVIAVGTGQAIRLASNGDADVLFVHHKPSEQKFVAAGHGVARHEVMYNDFVIVGPAADPAGVRGMTKAGEALAKIAGAEAPFASRGDDSGTNKAERGLWRKAGQEPHGGTQSWYREMGSGMGATLNAAVSMGAYTLSDRATWISFANRGQHEILVEGDPALFNQYAVMLVNPARHPHIKAKQGQAFIDWLLSPEGQHAIAEFRVQGQQLFFPNAGD